MSYESIDIYNELQLEKLNCNGIINNNIVIRGNITIKNIIKINGSLGITNKDIKHIGSIEIISKDFWISNIKRNSAFNSLRNLKEVGGDVSLRYVNIKSLNKLKKVGGKISLRDTPIQNINSLCYVGGNISLPQHIKINVKLSNIKILGKVMFWKNVEEFQVNNYSMQSTTIFDYLEGKVNIYNFHRDHILRLLGIKGLTKYCKNNIEEITTLFREQIYIYEKSVDNDIISHFLKNKKLEDYSNQEKYKLRDKVILELYNILRNAENIHRVINKIPKIGEGWISETELYYKLKNHFKKYEIIHHASLKWLGRQHLDIFIPEINLAIEYQGKQHIEPVEFFGGQKAFKLQKERDLRKQSLCEKNKIKLIYVYEDYNYGKLIEIIYKHINFLKQDQI